MADIRGVKTVPGVVEEINKGRIQAVADPDGDVHNNMGGLCRKYGLKVETLNSRLGLGWGLRQALESSIRENHGIDYKGNVYKSTSEMCRTYGVNRSTYIKRLKLGWTIEQALTTSMK